jgi:hypothetical protein
LPQALSEKTKFFSRNLPYTKYNQKLPRFLGVHQLFLIMSIAPEDLHQLDFFLKGIKLVYFIHTFFFVVAQDMSIKFRDRAHNAM